MAKLHKVAAIDLGTVSSRLVLAEVSDGTIVSSNKHTEITDLGEGVDATGRFCEGAVERVTAACSTFVNEARAFGAECICTTLTSAARDVSNGELLLGRLRDLDLKPQVISGLVEARLTFFGVAHDFLNERILVADSGGGSTELVCGSYVQQLGTAAERGRTAEGQRGAARLELEDTQSLNIGCRRVTERFLLSDPATDEEIARASRWAEEQFSEYWTGARDGATGAVAGAGRVPGAATCAVCAGDAAKPERLVAVGGTVTTLVAMVYELKQYDSAFVHLHDLTLAEVETAIERMRGLVSGEIATLPGIQPKRARVILAGSLVIRALMRTGGYDRLTVSENSLLAGMAATINEALDGVEPTIGWTPELS